MNLRAHLEALSAGTGPRPRGNVLPADDLATHSNISKALGKFAYASLARGSYQHPGRPASERISAPSSLLAPLP